MDPDRNVTTSVRQRRPRTSLVVTTPTTMTKTRSGSRRPRRQRSLFIPAVAAGFIAGVAIGGGLAAYQHRASTTARAARAPAAGESIDAAPLPTIAPSLPVSALPSATDLPPRSGRLVTKERDAGHRVFVDGVGIGVAGPPLVVHCGRHEVRVGTWGRLRSVEVPCGGQVEVAR